MSDHTAGRGGRRLTSAVKEILLIVVGALVISALLRAFVFEPFTIPSGSMENTLQVNDKVIAQKITDFDRGDVIVFRDPGNWVGGATLERTNPIGKALEFAGVLPNSSDDFLTKRVVGMPGDRMQCCDEQGRMAVNGAALEEHSYLYSDGSDQVAPSEAPFDVVVPRDTLFVLGDHRNASADSRCHMGDPAHDRPSRPAAPGGSADAGFVPIDHVVGAVELIVAPFDRWQRLRTPDAYNVIPPPAEKAPETAAIIVPPAC